MKQLTVLMQARFDEMCKTGKLFRSSISGERIWQLYLESFSDFNDPVFRDPQSSTHNCNHCNNFIRRYGNIVAIDPDDLSIMTIFDIELDEDNEYYQSCNNISHKLQNAKVEDVFFETFYELNSLPYESCNKSNSVFKLGIASNIKRYTKEEAEKFGVVKPNETRTFDHFHLSLPKAFVDFSNRSYAAIAGDYRSNKEVFKRALDEIPLDTLELVRDLIQQGSLLNGDAQLSKVNSFIAFKKRYMRTKDESKDNWSWIESYGNIYAKFRNELIGTLCVALAEGEDLNKACKDWNYRVDPVNYMKAVAPITKAQINQAKKFVEENGYEESFIRRCATIDDIKANDILHLNEGDGNIPKVSIFDSVQAKSTRHKRSEFDGVEEVTIEKFMKDILPNCTSVEAYVENRMKGNFVTMTTSNDKQSKPIFKWDNNFSWTYNGNLAGKSMIKEAVKSAGGKVDAYLRFSLIWNEDGKDTVDLDAHCIEPGGNEISFGHKRGNYGHLDVDMIRPKQMGVENIYFIQETPGRYRFFVHNFDGGNHKNFKCEVAIGDDTFIYHYDKKLSGKVDIATVTLKENGEYDITHNINPSSEGTATSNIYNIDTNEFHKVNLVCLSPNFWTNEVGHKHYFFMLENCKAPDEIRSFHNENLISELLEHRKVLDVLGETTKVQSVDKQLSGLGFNATVRDEVILKIKGSHKRVIKVKF